MLASVPTTLAYKWFDNDKVSHVVKEKSKTTTLKRRGRRDIAPGQRIQELV